MKRLAPLALLATLALWALPAAAQTCDPVAEGVLFCPSETAWEGIAGTFDEGLGTMRYGRDSVMLMLGPLPDFAAAAWDGTEASLQAVADALAADAGAPVQERPELVGPDYAAASVVYPLAADLVALLTVIDLGAGPMLVQTVDRAAAVSEAMRALHLDALVSLAEEDL